MVVVHALQVCLLVDRRRGGFTEKKKQRDGDRMREFCSGTTGWSIILSRGSTLVAMKVGDLARK